MKLETQTIEDFQPLHRNANLIKRGHCKSCKENGIRFDARILGFFVGWTKGKKEYESCVGCYWYDIEDFHKHFIFNDNIIDQIRGITIS